MAADLIEREKSIRKVSEVIHTIIYKVNYYVNQN